MILTSKSIANIDKTIDYCLQPSKISDVLCSDGLDLSGLSLDNTEQHDTSNVRGDFLLYQNPRLKKPYLSLILSPEIDLKKKKLQNIVKDLLDEMGLNNNQMIAITHMELRGEEQKPVKHVHILVNRVDFDGNTFKDNYIGLKGIQAISRISKRYDLKDVYNSRDYNKKTTKKANSKFHSEKIKKIEELQKIVKQIIYSPKTHSINDVFDELKIEHGVDVEITKFKNGRFGVVFNFVGQSLKASEVSRQLTVVPHEDSYTANRLLQPILDSNLQQSNEKPWEAYNRVLREYAVHQDTERFEFERLNLMSLMAFDNQERKQSDREERGAAYLRKKHSRKGKQLGFKVKI